MVFGVIIGFRAEPLHDFLLGQLEPLRDTVTRLDQMDNSQLWIFIFIFINNFVKSLVVVFLGALAGLFPILFLVMNGLLIGFVVSWATDAGASLYEVIVLGLLPHGVFELTAIVIAAAYGLRYGVVVIRRYIRKSVANDKLQAFHSKLGRLVAFLFWALLIAAFIESTVTYALVRG
jgi:stage II sporulation protein M